MFFKSDEKGQTPSEYAVLNNRFSIKIPTEWKDNTVYSFEGPEEDGVRHNIIVTIENNVEITELKMYAEMRIDAVANELKGYNELKRCLIELKNRVPAYEVVYKWCPVDNRVIYQRVIYILQNSTGFILTASFSKKTWKTKGPEIDKILKSFTVQGMQHG